jgi:hypothetical protein
VICIYALRLTATNANGQAAATEIAVIVSGQMKVSNLPLAFSDLLPPVLQFNVVQRQYKGASLIPFEI